jgi:hypothetical protein
MIPTSCGPVVRILDDILISCQNNATLEAAHQLLRTLTSNPKFSGGVDTAEMLEDVLDGIGFGGLWRSSSFHTANEHERQCTALTDRLIEVSRPVCPIDFVLMLTFNKAHYCIKETGILANHFKNFMNWRFMFDEA